MSPDPTGQAAPHEGAASPRMVRAVMGWRWMPGHPSVPQSFIVRVPEDKLEAELAWHRANTPWPELPRPSIVEVPALEPTEQARYFDAVKDETVALHVDTSSPGHVLMQMLSALDNVATVLERESIEQMHAQLGAWLESTQ